MDDTRLQTAKEECMEVLKELEEDFPDIPRAVQLLESAREAIVAVVGEALAMYGRHNRDLNGLDAARTYINRAAKLLKPDSQEWVFSHAQQFTGYAVDELQVVLSGNVTSIHRPKPTTPGGAA